MASSLKITRKYWQQKSHRVLVDQHRLTRTEWRSLFKALTRDFAAHAEVLDEIGLEEPPAGDRADPRELLIWAWVALKAMPFGTAQDYRRLKEDEATDGSLPRLVREARRTKFVFRGLHDALDLQLKWTAALVRAADEALSGASLWPADPLSWKPEHWTPPGYSCFVIPVHREYRIEEGKSRERRSPPPRGRASPRRIPGCRDQVASGSGREAQTLARTVLSDQCELVSRRCGSVLERRGLARDERPLGQSAERRSLYVWQSTRWRSRLKWLWTLSVLVEHGLIAIDRDKDPMNKQNHPNKYEIVGL